MVKNTVPWAYVIEDMNGKETVGMICEKVLQKTNKKKLIESSVKKDDKLFLK